jgi:peptide/nickel transport system substrate-binding protein
MRSRFRRMTRVVLSGTVLIVLGCVLCGVLAFGQSDRSTIRLGYTQDIVTLDAPLVTQVPDYPLIMNIFDGLVRFKQGPDVTTQELEPDLAERWEISPDGLTYTFYLRGGVQFQKGYGEFTAEDVKYSFDRVLNADFKCPERSAMQIIESITVVDPLTIAIKLKSPSSGFLRGVLAYRAGYIVSRKAAEEKGWKAFGLDPIGTGPYMLDSRVPGESLTLVANDGYWRGAPQIKKVIMYVIPDEMTAALSLVSGSLDMMINRVATVTAFLETQPGVSLMISPGETRGLVVNTQHLSDLRVRQALAHAMDPAAIVSSAMLGLGFPLLQTPLSPAMFGYTDDLCLYPYNPAKAVELLAAAGYGPGQLKVSIAVRSYDAPWVEAVAGFWREVGIDATLNVLESGAFSAIRPTENWDLLATIPTRPDATLIFPYFASANIPSPNFARYTAVDALQNEYTITTDEARQRELLQAWQRQISCDLPYIYTVDATRVTVTRSELKGDSPNTHYWLTLFYYMHY